MEAYVNGVSTRKVDRLVEQLGHRRHDQGPRLGAVPGARRAGRGVPQPAARGRATRTCGWTPSIVKVRDRGHVYSKALVIAYAVHETGRREVIGLDIGEIESEAFWVAVPALAPRARPGRRPPVRSPTSTTGLKNAIARILGCPWQRCTVHFVRDMHAPLPAGPARAWSRRRCGRSSTPTSLAAARERCGAGDRAPRRGPAPKVAELLEGAEEDLLAFYRFPAAHWPKLRSTNPLERVNREIGRRADVVGHLPQRRRRRSGSPARS